MKIYISVDLEGVCGTIDWDEVTRGEEPYPEFQKQMTAEVVAACEGAYAAGATEIVIRDAHDTARNMIAADLPENTTLIRGWSGHPYMMMQELDDSYDAVLMIGYHSYAGGGRNPLSHSMATKVAELTINGEDASEFVINTYTALYEKVPVVFVSGDLELCEHAEQVIDGIQTVGVKSGVGASSVNLHPKTAADKIRESVQKVLEDDCSKKMYELPEYFETVVTYNHAKDAYRPSFYPGAQLISPRSVSFESDDYFEILRFYLFAL